MKKQNEESRYPIVVREGEKPLKKYLGIIFNGDCCIYKKGTLKALKEKKVKKEIIKKVKKKKFDLEISKYLIENDFFDVLVCVYSICDAETAISDYIENSSEHITNKFGIESFNLDKLILSYTSGKSEFNSEEVQKVIEELDGEIDSKQEEIIKELQKFYLQNVKSIQEKFDKAQADRIEQLRNRIVQLEKQIRNKTACHI